MKIVSKMGNPSRYRHPGVNRCENLNVDSERQLCNSHGAHLLHFKGRRISREKIRDALIGQGLEQAPVPRWQDLVRDR